MNRFMDFLHTRMKPLVETHWFEVIMSLIIFANPVAIAPQVLMAFTAPSVEGIAVPMWFIFAAIQAAFVFHGIKTRSASVFLSMLMSFLESIAIIAAVYIRG
jgi:hypothetical protein